MNRKREAINGWKGVVRNGYLMLIWLIIRHWAVSVMVIIHCVCFFCIAEVFYLFLFRR